MEKILSMEKKQTNRKKSGFWFYQPGKDEDVIISTRARLVRNLADFKFPQKMSLDETRRLVSLVDDAFSYDNNFIFLPENKENSLGSAILRENSMIGNSPFSAIEINSSKTIICLINELNHIKIINFCSGFDCENIMKNVYEVDENLQKKLQFAASVDFGYLTSQIKDCGTGLKISLRVFIPSLVLSGKFDDFVNNLTEQKFCFRPIVNPDKTTVFENFFFDVYPAFCEVGTELEQLAQIQAIGMHILKTERKFRQEFAENNPIIVLNFIRSNFAKAINSLLLSYEDAMNAISIVKWGIQTDVLTGISETDLNSLLYLLKQNHLLFINSSYDFSFEKEIKNNKTLLIQRLRATVLQQAFENVKFK